LVAYGEMAENAKRVGGYKEVGGVCHDKRQVQVAFELNSLRAIDESLI
jgi:hypothetical protein